jgi:hypothetical protein
VKRLLVAICALAAVATGFFIAYERWFRIQPLPEVSRASPRVRNANDDACSKFGVDYASPPLIFVQTVQGHDQNLIKINHETMSVEEAKKYLQGIYSPRAARVVFILAPNTDIAFPGYSEALSLVEHIDVIDTVCIINPNKPPKWFPPKEVVNFTVQGH